MEVNCETWYGYEHFETIRMIVIWIAHEIYEIHWNEVNVGFVPKLSWLGHWDNCVMKDMKIET